MTDINMVAGPASTLIDLVGSVVQNGNSISWNIENDDVEAFKSSNVYRNTVDDRATATLIDSINQSSQYIDSEIVAGTTYYYWLRAINALNLENGEWSSVNGLEIVAKQVEQEDLGDSIGGDNYDFQDISEYIVPDYSGPNPDPIEDGGDTFYYKFLTGDSAVGGLLATIDPFSQIKTPQYIINSTSTNAYLRANVTFKIYRQTIGALPGGQKTLLTGSGQLVHWEWDATGGDGIIIDQPLISWTYTFGVDATQQYLLAVQFEKDRWTDVDALSMVSNLRAYNLTVA